MRLNPFDTSKINVGTTGGARGGRGRAAGGAGCLTIIAALVGAVVFGVDPSQTMAVLGGLDSGSGQSVTTGSQDEQAICSSNAYAAESCAALTSLNETWSREFAAQGVAFREPRLLFKTADRFQTACGVGTRASGPFYCPADETIYIDVAFYDQLARMAGDNGDFARLYVMAHEYGHHIQAITGIMDQVRSAQNANPRAANQLNVLMELQADCYAGAWAGKNRDKLDPGDLEEGLRAASAVGDDTIQRRSGGHVHPESFTHGSSQQRQQALALGLRDGDQACDRITQPSR